MNKPRQSFPRVSLALFLGSGQHVSNCRKSLSAKGWAMTDSNRRHPPCKGGALAN